MYDEVLVKPDLSKVKINSIKRKEYIIKYYKNITIMLKYYYIPKKY